MNTHLSASPSSASRTRRSSRTRLLLAFLHLSLISVVAVVA